MLGGYAGRCIKGLCSASLLAAFGWALEASYISNFNNAKTERLKQEWLIDCNEGANSFEDSVGGLFLGVCYVGHLYNGRSILGGIPSDAEGSL